MEKERIESLKNTIEEKVKTIEIKEWKKLPKRMHKKWE
jgi:hypothetical protein